MLVEEYIKKRQGRLHNRHFEEIFFFSKKDCPSTLLPSCDKTPTTTRKITIWAGTHHSKQQPKLIFFLVHKKTLQYLNENPKTNNVYDGIEKKI